MQRILVPTDFSTNAMKAETYASEIAQKCGATVYLLHVIEPAIDTVIDSLTQSNLFMDKIVNERLNQLSISQKIISENYPGIKIETELARGPIINSIFDFIEDNKVDLIVMGTTGATGLYEIIMGSIAAGTISKSKIPVLTVPAAFEMVEPKTILLATNHFEEDEELLNPVITLAKYFSATIDVVVLMNANEAVEEMQKNYTMELNHYLEFLKKTYPGNNFKGDLLEGNDFEMAIDKYSSKNEVDLIAMIPYPKNIPDRILQKSITKKMALHSTIPLITLPVKR